MSDGEDRTVFIPGSGSAPPAPPPTSFPAAAPRQQAGRLQAGDVLNGVYEVRRHIASGGMGDVWEGASTHGDERVAIKVILPHLAADPNVQAMFRKEAATLRRIQHPVIVPYRMMTVEPQLGLLYIVTDYVDGAKLEDRLRDAPTDARAIAALGRRIAEGLAAAHDLGAIHRDLSPDNILLEDGSWERPRVIDFGIAKDLDPGRGTIVGDGFAGKLGFVAPEQLGMFGRDVGAWTDVYSLGLVLLAVAAGRAIDMGATLYEAVEKRRDLPDLTFAPEPLRPALAAMLRPDPAERLRTMREAAAALAGEGVPVAPARPTPAETVRPPVAPTLRGRAPLLAGAGAGALLLAGLGWWALAGDDPAPAPASTPTAAASSPAPSVAGDPVAAVRAAVGPVLAATPCSWVELRDVRRDGEGVAIELAGAAGDPVAATGAVRRAAAGAAPVRSLRADGLIPIPAELCAVADAYRPFRAQGEPVLRLDKTEYELEKLPNPPAGAEGVPFARVPLVVDAREVSDFTLAGWDEQGGLAEGSGRGEMEAAGTLRPTPDGRLTIRDGGGAYVATGTAAYVLVRGTGPFAKDVVAAPAADAAWAARFRRAAEAKGWRTEMKWFRLKNEKPD